MRLLRSNFEVKLAKVLLMSQLGLRVVFMSLVSAGANMESSDFNAAMSSRDFFKSLFYIRQHFCVLRTFNMYV